MKLPILTERAPFNLSFAKVSSLERGAGIYQYTGNTEYVHKQHKAPLRKLTFANFTPYMTGMMLIPSQHMLYT